MLDLKIVNSLLISGDGCAPRYGEIGVKGGRIIKIDDAISNAAQTELDARGSAISPGFIDLHTHCLPGRNENFLQMGVTTAVGGNCGFSPLDIGEIALNCPGKCGLNLAMLVGHNSVRLNVMGNLDKTPSKPELDKMAALISRAMEDGATGFSSGLTYVPGHYARFEELAELAKAASGFGGYYASHMRDEGEGLISSIRETVETGLAGGLPVHISHLKVRGHNLWGLSAEVIKLLDDYAARGLDITQDQYPYTASCGRIYLLFPQWAQEGEADDCLMRLSNPEQRSRITRHLVKTLAETYGGDGENVVISSAPDPSIGGRSIAEIASDAGRDNEPLGLAETILEIVARFPEQGEVFCIFHSISEEDLKTIMTHPKTATGSDAWAMTEKEVRPHPRLFGTFPRVLGHYSREQNLFPLEEAVRRMTHLPARVLGLNDRGLLREGAWADLVVFDPATIADRATFEAPIQYPVGIEHVFVNGQMVIERGSHTGALAGVFLRNC